MCAENTPISPFNTLIIVIISCYKQWSELRIIEHIIVKHHAIHSSFFFASKKYRIGKSEINKVHLSVEDLREMLKSLHFSPIVCKRSEWVFMENYSKFSLFNPSLKQFSLLLKHCKVALTAIAYDTLELIYNWVNAPLLKSRITIPFSHVKTISPTFTRLHDIFKFLKSPKCIVRQ